MQPNDFKKAKSIGYGWHEIGMLVFSLWAVGCAVIIGIMSIYTILFASLSLVVFVDKNETDHSDEEDPMQIPWIKLCFILMPTAIFLTGSFFLFTWMSV